jgi:hypothetical protein
MDIGNRAGASETGVDVDQCCTAALGLHGPAEPDRVALGHVRTLDHYAVGVLEILLKGGSAAAPEADPQTGDRGGVSYAGLILDLNCPQRGEQLLD